MILLILILAGQTITGAAPTVTVAVIGVPGHPLATGVIVNVTVTGLLVVLVSVPEIFPDPLAAMPVAAVVLSLVQLKVVPVTFPLRLMGVIAPEQTVCVAMDAVAVGVGFTVTLNVTGVPVQPFAEGVTVKVTTAGALVVLTSEPLIAPEPLAAIPVTAVVLLRVQVNVVLATVPDGLTVVIAEPEQMVCGAIALTTGLGFTSTADTFVPSVQPLAVPAILNVTVTGAVVVLTREPAIVLPVPEADMPVTDAVLSLVQLYVAPDAVLDAMIFAIASPLQIVCVPGETDVTPP